MDYKLALELKEAGFPQKSLSKVCVCSTFTVEKHGSWLCMHDERVSAPTLEELIEACGNIQLRIWSYWVENDLQWQADNDPFCTDVHNMKSGLGSTPLEAVARLWIALNKK